MSKIEEFSILYLNYIKQDINNKKVQYKLLSITLNSLIERRKKTIDSMLDSYNISIFNVKAKMEEYREYSTISIDKSLDKIFIKIIEKICPSIYDLSDELLELYFLSYDSYVKGSKELLNEILVQIKHVELVPYELDIMIEYLKDEIKAKSKNIRLLNNRIIQINKLLYIN